MLDSQLRTEWTPHRSREKQPHWQHAA